MSLIHSEELALRTKREGSKEGRKEGRKQEERTREGNNKIHQNK
jgi:hypothetical protein